ncbi:MAG: DUF4127 family protein [Blastocatellia bacterium]
MAGKIILLPGDDRFLELRMLAQIADHYLLLPPSSLLMPKPQTTELIEWLKAQNLAGVSGVIVSLDAGAAEVSPVLKQFRSQNPKLAIYGLASLDSSSEASKQSCQTAVEMVAGGSLDFLLIGQEEDLTTKPAQIARARLIGEAASQEVGDRIAFANYRNSLTATLLARMLATLLGRSPKILPVYSSGEGRASKDENSIPLNQSVAAAIKLTGGTLLIPNAETAPQVDVLMFVHTPRTSEDQRTAMTMNLLQIIDSGVRVAFLDFSESKKTKEAMLTELRQHKLMGKLSAYASTVPGDSAREALSHALAQTAIFFSAMKSLRDDIDRVHRIERAQVNLLFSRILEDWSYNLIVRARLEEFVRQQSQGDPNQLGDKTDRAEKFVFTALQKLATELFDEQFRRNTHAILMNSGTRVQFRISLLQQLQIRFPSQKASEPEIRQTIHTFFDGYLPGSSRESGVGRR